MAIERDDAGGEARWIWAVLFFCVAAFAKVPSLDMMVTGHLYTPGLGFIHAHNALVLASYDWTPLIGRSILAGLVALALLGPVLARLMHRLGWEALAAQCLGPWRRMAAVAVLCGVLGPGLVVEVWLKNTVGRPRPVQVTAFGGDQPFHGVLQQGSDPATHRSFVSSHAAAGFWLLSLGLTAGPVWRRRWLLIGLLAGSLIGLGRMMQGGHFLSDIIFSFYAVWIPCVIIAALDRRRHQDQ
ncbi:MAG: phosphatase PAP2 family protein [Aquabacterium sp.]|uniref:phosphatase PAP2 family protein n=1 Tax=Aquabacterium sp. TaxID=1872578 RepID=UPI002724D1CA|nr:phosphatase PAP2 family protein [Aquabacterium sp.]MDO9006520.1 phosphatase PAP2 family protein [Aquabacterium sp.]